jgi:glycosyltransferase involved in cell wall biosynthesis
VDLARDPKPPRPPGGPLRLGYLGQVAFHKGVDLVIEAVRALPAGTVLVSIFGSEKLEPEYAARLRAASAGLPVRFGGPFARADAGAILAGLDVVAVPSRWAENSPLVLLEALATHTPVIVSDGPGLTEMVEPGRNGHVFESGSARDLARVLGPLAADPGAARVLSATTEYPRTTRMMTEETLAVYDAIGRAPPP